MAVQRFLTLVNGLRTLVVPATSSTGAASAGLVVATTTLGLLDDSLIAHQQLNTRGTTPTFTQSTTGLGLATTVTLTGNDVAGTISIAAGVGCGSGAIALGTTNFAGTHTTAPRAILLAGANANAARLLGSDKATWSVTGWGLLQLSTGAMTAGTTYAYSYLVVW